MDRQRRIACGPQRYNRITKYAANRTSQSPGSFPATGLLDPLEEIEDFLRRDLSDGTVFQCPGQVFEQPAVLAHGCFGRFRSFLVRKHFSDHRTERIPVFPFRRLLGLTAMCGGIDSFFEQLTRLVPPLASFGDRSGRIGAECDHLLAIRETIPEAPFLAPVWFDEKDKAQSIGELISSLRWRGLGNGEV